MIGLNPDLVTLLKKNPNKISYGNVSPDTENGGNYYIKNSSSTIDMFNKLEKWNYWGHLDNEDASSSVIPISEISTEAIYLEKVQKFFNSSYTYLQFLTDLRDALLSNSIATSTEMFETVKSDLGSVLGISDITDNWSEVYIDTFNGNILCTTGITNGLKSTLDTRFKTPSNEIIINNHTWLLVPFSLQISQNSYTVQSTYHFGGSSFVAYYTRVGDTLAMASWEPYIDATTRMSLGGADWTGCGNYFYTYNGIKYQNGSNNDFPSQIVSQYASYFLAFDDFYNNFGSHTGGDPHWNNSGYYTDADSAYIINPSALPLVNWKGVTNKNFTEFGENYLTTDIPTEYNNIANTYDPNNPPSVIPDWLLK